MSVRRADPQDAPALGRIHIETWQIAYSEMFPEGFLAGLDHGRRAEWFERTIGEGREVWVTPDSGEPAGFSLFGESRSNNWGELYAIYVHPDHWGEGHGHRLLARSESRLVELGYDRALLWVLEENDRARRFYERQGWSLGRPVKLEEIGGTQVTEVRYEKDLRAPS